VGRLRGARLHGSDFAILIALVALIMFIASIVHCLDRVHRRDRQAVRSNERFNASIASLIRTPA
jgi:hypothetical protein